MTIAHAMHQQFQGTVQAFTYIIEGVIRSTKQL